MENTQSVPVTAEQRNAELNSLRMQTLLETVTAQRNDSQNSVANLAADKAVLNKALNEVVQVTKIQEEAINNLNHRIADLTQALSEAQEALRKFQPESID
jgi:NAD/NADP transhydrogenase alpha subunit